MKHGHFFVGDVPHQMYVEYLLAEPKQFRHPIVLIHGGSHTGVTFSTTPDGREGWFSWFGSHGFDTYVVDLPGHGRSGTPDDYATLSMHRYAERVSALLHKLQGAVLVGHSLGGGVVWMVADELDDQSRHLLRGVVGLAPAPPANVMEQQGSGVSEDRPRRLAWARVQRWSWSPTFPKRAVDEYYKSLVPESGRAANEVWLAEGKGISVQGPEILRGIPALIIWGEEDKVVPYDKIAAFFGIQEVRLGRDWGMPGHHHMFMMEEGNLDIARRLADWLTANIK